MSVACPRYQNAWSWDLLADVYPDHGAHILSFLKNQRMPIKSGSNVRDRPCFWRISLSVRMLDLAYFAHEGGSTRIAAVMWWTEAAVDRSC